MTVPLCSHRKSRFLPTPSARRATRRLRSRLRRPQHFYPRPPRGGRPSARALNRILREISTHALREEGDNKNPVKSRPVYISTHALREEGDQGNSSLISPIREFLPTPSARRATGPGEGCLPLQRISTHALREEGDRICRGPRPAYCDFYPRPPRGGRHTVLVLAANAG